MPSPKPRGRGRPKSARVRIDAAVLPEVEAVLRARAKQLAKAEGNRRPQLGAAIESYVLSASQTFPCGCRGECTCGSRAHL